jgi:coenzyme F420-0:L-glutamate ligase/coenzyme F420-1:gamma-L-glutamate ligase
VSQPVQIWGIDGLPEVHPGDDLAGLIAAAAPDLQDRDVIVVTSKVVSKAEGRLVPGSRDDHLAAETWRVVARRDETAIVETRHGFVLAAAGIDGSNVPAGVVALLPLDPDASARQIREGLQRISGVDVAVIVSDTMGRPWRDGLIDTAIGAAGLDVLWDLRGQLDAAGHRLEATVVAVGDELAAAADLVKGKLASTPVAVIRGFPFRRSDVDDGARPLIRAAADDLFRLGTREAMRQVVIDSAPVSAADHVDDEKRIDRESVVHAVDLVWSAGVALEISADNRTISATGEPFETGLTVGRLLAALAAAGLRGELTATPPGASAAIRIIAATDP